jgi:hypothetical protein
MNYQIKYCKYKIKYSLLKYGGNPNTSNNESDIIQSIDDMIINGLPNVNKRINKQDIEYVTTSDQFKQIIIDEMDSTDYKNQMNHFTINNDESYNRLIDEFVKESGQTIDSKILKYFIIKEIRPLINISNERLNKLLDDIDAIQRVYGYDSMAIINGGKEGQLLGSEFENIINSIMKTVVKNVDDSLVYLENIDLMDIITTDSYNELVKKYKHKYNGGVKGEIDGLICMRSNDKLKILKVIEMKRNVNLVNRDIKKLSFLMEILKDDSVKFKKPYTEFVKASDKQITDNSLYIVGITMDKQSHLRNVGIDVIKKYVMRTISREFYHMNMVNGKLKPKLKNNDKLFEKLFRSYENKHQMNNENIIKNYLIPFLDSGNGYIIELKF